MWDFLKKLKKPGTAEAAPAAAAPKPPEPGPAAAVPPAAVSRTPAPPAPAAPKAEKPHAEKSDDELTGELDKISPEILSQAKTPQMRKMIIDLYRKMLVAGVDVKDDKEVKKWLQKHPEAVHGGEVHKVETVRREAPKIGRNEPCPCGSGKKHKKCCGEA